MLSGPYRELHRRLARWIPRKNLIADDLRLFTYGTDASFYRLVPKLVVRVRNEEEVVHVLHEAGALKLPVTFRAAGTSLSGQAVSDSVLMMLAPTWTRSTLEDGAARIRLQPGLVGARANQLLAPFGRKIGPDPASINSAMIGGIAANNASGMCCGTAQNSYRTLAAMRIIFADGSVLDTGNPEARASFVHYHGDMVNRIGALAARVKADTALADRIRRKFKMKNTTGYGLNALVDYDDPVDVLQHLMIGSEGTLGFISEITFNTVPDHAHKATALMLFPDIETACKAVAILKTQTVDAVELMDRASLRSVETKPGMPDYLAALGPGVAGLLVETRAAESAELAGRVAALTAALQGLPQVRPVAFTEDTAEYTRLWNIRKGLFPSVGAMRATGTTVIIEDVAFPVPRLAEATLELQGLFRKHGYDDAIIFGHALEGNLHFVFKQDFRSPSEVERYRKFIDDVCRMTVEKYDGSLKAEHGTGRNMAPYVELEWGAQAYGIMKEIKEIVDPGRLLNPGVILNEDHKAHVKDLKALPPAHEVVDKCIECGFCEVHCPSRDLTSTPRQRIVAYREISRLRADGSDPERLETFLDGFGYFANETCATDGLCATACPVGIDTGKLIKDLRRVDAGLVANVTATAVARNMATVVAVMKGMLTLAHWAHIVLGARLMAFSSRMARKLTFNKLPLWNRYMPKAADAVMEPSAVVPGAPTVVYFPTCINRAMGVSRDDSDPRSLSTVIHQLLVKAGFNVVYPENLDGLCCGMPFASKGFKKQGDVKAFELEAALLEASDGGKHPVLMDMSPCLYRMKEVVTSGLKLYEPVRFILEHAADRLEFRKLPVTVAVHTTCSAEKMGLAADLRALAEKCAEKVVVPAGVECCGWAGDRGFTYPELNKSALKSLRGELPADCREGYSTSRTCEIGLSVHSGIPYRSIIYLVDRAVVKQTL